MKTAQMQQSLEAAISKHQNAEFTGAFSVYAEKGHIQLVWSCNEDDALEMYGDEPWTEWGGAAIIESACIGETDDSGCDGYRDKYGDQVVSQWVQWNTDDDDEGYQQ